MVRHLAVPCVTLRRFARGGRAASYANAAALKACAENPERVEGRRSHTRSVAARGRVGKRFRRSGEGSRARPSPYRISGR